MSVAKEKRAVFDFDSPEIQSLLKTIRKSKEVKVQPAEVGYRLLPNYFGSDVIEVLIVLPSDFNVDNMTYEDTSALKQIVRSWSKANFPEFTIMFSFDQ
ncbi:MAG: hypothetical protein ACOCZ8_04730 [Bacteroidota bacterium]